MADNRITVNLDVKLNALEAMALAKFCKRMGFEDYREQAIGETEAYAMQAAHSRIQIALAEKGYAPR